MNFKRIGLLPIAVAIGLLCATAVWAQGVQSQKAAPVMELKKALPEPMQKHQQQTVIPGQCTTADKIMVVGINGLTLNPAQPKAGEAVVVSLTIQNLCNVPLANIGWQIASTPDNTILLSGVKASVAAKEIFTVTAPWTAVSGRGGFDGRVDPANALKESADDRKNNVKTASVTVPMVVVMAPTQPRRVTERLNYDKAKNAGARFAHNLEGVTACSRIGQIRPDSSAAIHFEAICALSGGKANPEAFKDFTLKNGWKVAGVTVNDEGALRGSSGWRWIVEPRVGSDNPGMQMHVWAEPVARLVAAVFVHIEGPEGTCPYEEKKGPC